MKIVKNIVFFILGGIYASSWWAAAMFAHESVNRGNAVFWAIPVGFTLGLICQGVHFLNENWNEE